MSNELVFKSGVEKKPARIILSGPKGVGKTFFGGHCPSAIMVSSEQGADQTDFPRIEVRTWDELRMAVREVHVKKHSFKTLVLDGANAESYLQQWVLGVENERLRSIGQTALDSFTQMNGGWGGHKEVLERWQAFTRYLDTIRDERNMNVVLIFHAKDKVQRNPSGADYKCWTLAMTEGVGEYLKGWCDASLFIDYDITISGDGKRPGKMTTSQKRQLTCLRSDGVEHAKNRYGLDESIQGSAHALFSRIARFLPDGLATARRTPEDEAE